MNKLHEFELWCEQGDYVDYGLPRLSISKDANGDYINLEYRVRTASFHL